MKLQIIPFRATHMQQIAQHVDPDIMQLSLHAQKTGHAWTACLLGRPIGAAGMSMNGCNTGQVWTVFSPLMKTRPLSLYREVKMRLEMVITEVKPTRIFAVVGIDDTVGQNFIERLNFKAKHYLYEWEVR